MSVKEKSGRRKKSFEEISAALFDNRGNLVATAESLKMPYQSLYWRIANTPGLKEAQTVAREVQPNFIADLAEEALAKKIKEGCTTSIIFALRTLGRKRGFEQNDIIKAQNVTIVHQKAEDKPEEIDGDSPTLPT